MLIIVGSIIAGMALPMGADLSTDFVAPDECTYQQLRAGLCEAGGDPGLAIGGHQQQPGSQPPAPEAPAPPGPPGGHTQPIVGPGPGTAPETPAGPSGEPGGWQCLDPAQQVIGSTCLTDPTPDPDPEPSAEPEPGAQPPAIPPITAYDVAVFVPAPAAPTIEPFGVAIARAPMNVAVAAASQTVGGELFGLPMSVTFTPELLTIDYGDGTVAKVAQAAPTWEQLGQEQLSPTATSHTYAERGTAAVSVDVSYSAVVDFGPWGVHPVSGYVVAEGPATDVRIYEKQSYLVAQTCAENPSGPGC